MRRAPDNNNNNFALTRPAGSSWPRRITDRVSSPDREEQGGNGHAHAAAAVPWPPRLRPEEDRDSGSTYAPWMLFEERVRTGPFGLRRFPSRPHSPVRILILDTNGIGGGSGAVDPALRQFVRDYSPPRLRGEWHLQQDAEPEDPGLTEEEFKKAMKKLRRHVHNPAYPRKRAWRRGLFSGRSGNDVVGGAEEESDEAKDCAICLETFGANEQVLMTPCSHMFHNDCIVPWVKSRGQCPVCRLQLCERSHRRRRQWESPAPAAPDAAGPAGGVVFDDEILYLIRAMEEALNWINLSR